MRRPKLTQHIPIAPTPTFQIFEPKKGDTYWHFKLADFQDEHAPELRYVPPKKGCHYTVQQLANAAAGWLAEARGIIQVAEWVDGTPIFSAIFVANGKQVFCSATTDSAKARVEAPRRLKATPTKGSVAPYPGTGRKTPPSASSEVL